MSVPRDQIGAKFCHIGNRWLTSLRQIFDVYFLFGKMLSQFWLVFNSIGLIFIVANGQIFKNNQTIWPHWTPSHLGEFCRNPFSGFKTTSSTITAAKAKATLNSGHFSKHDVEKGASSQVREGYCETLTNRLNFI